MMGRDEGRMERAEVAARAAERPGARAQAASRAMRWAPLAVGVVLALVLLEAARHRITMKTDELAFGRDTQHVLVEVDGRQVHCQDATDSEPCVAGYKAAGRPPAALWLGNSQLHAINRYKSGEEGAATILHKRLAPRGLYLVAYSQPNSNLIEHAVVYSALSTKYDLRLLILPVFLDKIREQGIRSTVAQFLDDRASRARIERSGMWRHVAPTLAQKPADEPGADGVPTFQRSFENGLNDALGAVWPLWQARPTLRGYAGITLHQLRNKVLGITSATKRKVDEGVFKEKLAVLEAILADARERRIRVLVYVPPYRDDIDGPYVAADYARLKADLPVIAARQGADFVDIDKVVPGPEWATVVDPVLGIEEDDFMHFTAVGHRRHADAIDAALRRIGF